MGLFTSLFSGRAISTHRWVSLKLLPFAIGGRLCLDSSTVSRFIKWKKMRIPKGSNLRPILYIN